MNEHKEARQTRCTHESTDLCLHEKGNDLQAGKGRSLQDAEEKETAEGNGRRLRNGSLNHFLSLPTCLLRLPKMLTRQENIEIWMLLEQARQVRKRNTLVDELEPNREPRANAPKTTSGIVVGL